jgi:hypothetical protein
MQFLAEQHLVAAKRVRRNGAARTGAERIPLLSAWPSQRKNVAAYVWTISIGGLLPPIGVSSMNKYVGFCRRVSTVHPSFRISGSSGDNIDAMRAANSFTMQIGVNLSEHPV